MREPLLKSGNKDSSEEVKVEGIDFFKEVKLKPYQSMQDFPEEKKENHLKQLVYETLLQASTGGVNSTSIVIVAFVCLPLAGVSSVIYYNPNLDSADSVANYLSIPQIPMQILLVSGGVVANFLLNAYFSYDVPKTIINRIKAIDWHCLPKSELAKINYVPQTTYTIIKNGAVGSIKLLLKAIPVAMSTAQYVSLGVEAGLSEELIASQLGAYGLMHWFAVTHFVENWVTTIIDIIKKFCCFRDPQSKFEVSVSNQRLTLISTYKTTISDTLHTLRQTWQNGERDSLAPIYSNMDRVLSRSSVTKAKEMLAEEAFDLHLQLLEKAKKSNTKPTHWLKLLPFHAVNAILTKFCYISYDLAVWSYAPGYCSGFIDYLGGNKEVCDNEYFITPVRLLMIFPLPYLACFIVAPNNTNKLSNLINQVSQEKYIKPIALQRYPKIVSSLCGIFAFLALFSWGATVTLNDNYISNLDLLRAANINTIAYNFYFNGFPIPSVALGLSMLILSFIGNCLGRRSDHLNQTLQDHKLEVFQEELLVNLDLIKNTANFLKQIRNINDNKKIKIIFGGKEPHEVLDSWLKDKDWIETLNFLINPTFEANAMVHKEKEAENVSDSRSKNDVPLQYTLRHMIAGQTQTEKYGQDSQVGKRQKERVLNGHNENSSSRWKSFCAVL